MDRPPAKTTSVIRAVKDRPDEVIVAGEVAEIRFPKGASLSLLASKLFVQLLDVAGADVTEDRAHRVTLRSLNWSHRELGELTEAFRELLHTEVSLTVNGRGGKRRKIGLVVADLDRPDEIEGGQGEIEWWFSRTFRAVVANSRHWAAISARAVLAMDCKYSPWLYQLAALHAGRKRVSEDWDLADLRERLGASAPSLRRWPDFKRYVLEPACAEINHLTGIGVAWEPIKRGRKVVGVRLSTWRKGREEIAAAAAELERHRAGRKERREGLVERIDAERQETRAEIAAKLAEINERRAHDRVAKAEGDPGQLDLEEAIAKAGVSLTPPQIRVGADQALAETGVRIDAEAAYADWLRAAAQRRDRLRNPPGHWIDYCKRRAREQRDRGR